MKTNLRIGKSVIIIYGKKSYQQKNKIYVNEGDFLSPLLEHKTDALALNEINRISRESINGKSIPQLFSYENFSIWWFIYSPLIVPFMRAINFVTHFIEFVERENPEKIFIQNDFDTLDLIQQICDSRHINLNYSRINFMKFKIRKELWRTIRKYGARKISKTKLKQRKDLFHNKKKSVPEITDRIIFAVPSDYHRSVFDPIEGKEKNGEWIIQNIINLLEDKKIVCIDLPSDLRESNKNLEERLSSEISWFPVEVIFSKNPKLPHNFLKKYNSIISSKQFRDLFEFKGISLWKQLENIFVKMNDPFYLPFWLELTESLKNFFQKNKPKVIFLPYEYGPLALSFIIGAKENKIKTIGISHASIYENIYGYSHEEFATDKNPFGFPLPDYTLLFGNFAKQVLEKQGYPPEKFVVFGKSDFFNLEKIEKALSERSLHKKYNIPPNRKVILFTSNLLQEGYSSYGKYSYDSQIWETLVKNFVARKDITLILKPHPREKNITVYKQILKKYNSLNGRIIQGNLQELLYVSSITVSIYSDTILDSLCMKKPVIRVKFDEVEHPIPYDKFGVVLPTSLDRLSENINNFLEDNKIQNSLEQNRARFIKEHFNIPEEEPRSILKRLIE